MQTELIEEDDFEVIKDKDRLIKELKLFIENRCDPILTDEEGTYNAEKETEEWKKDAKKLGCFGDESEQNKIQVRYNGKPIWGLTNAD